MLTKTKLAIRVSSDLKEFVKTNKLEDMIIASFKNQFKEIVFHYPDEQQSLLDAKLEYGVYSSDSSRVFA